MDILSILGFLFAAIAVLGGSVLKGSGISALWSGAAFLIVIIGTASATLTQVPMQTVRRALGIVGWVFKPPSQNPGAIIEKVTGWSQTARKEGLLGLEENMAEESDPFIKKALQLLVDGSEPESIQQIMDVEISTREDLDNAAAKVFEAMGVYAPTMGILGAVMGLMAVMQNLGDPSKLGSGIAAAFVATIYGIGSANLFFLPMAGKLKGIVQAQAKHREMIVEGIVSIAQGENPRNIESKLQGFMS